MKTRRIAGALGAEISGVDLSKGLSAALAEDIRSVLLEHQVIFLRGQHLAPAQFLAFAQAMGMTLDLTSRGMGLRSDRYSMLIKNGVVTSVNREAPGKFEVSDAATILAQAKN